MRVCRFEEKLGQSVENAYDSRRIGRLNRPRWNSFHEQVVSRNVHESLQLTIESKTGLPNVARPSMDQKRKCLKSQRPNAINFFDSLFEYGTNDGDNLAVFQRAVTLQS